MQKNVLIKIAKFSRPTKIFSYFLPRGEAAPHKLRVFGQGVGFFINMAAQKLALILVTDRKNNERFVIQKICSIRENFQLHKHTIQFK